MTFRNGLDSLLRPEDSVLVLIDHQPFQLDPGIEFLRTLDRTVDAFGVADQLPDRAALETRQRVFHRCLPRAPTPITATACPLAGYWPPSQTPLFPPP